MLGNIAEFGWHCVHILGENEQPEYSFAIGLFHTYRHPELIVFSLPSTVAHSILSIAAHEAGRGEPIDINAPTDALLTGYSCCFAEVPPSQYHENVGFARWYYQGNDFPLFQIIWPSRSGFFPWHAEASMEFRSMQPVLAHSACST